jgi:hypothetical protein
MRLKTRPLSGRLLASIVAVMAVAGTTAALATPGSGHAPSTSVRRGTTDSVRLRLTPSSPELAQCMPDASVRVRVELTTDQIGFDSFRISARHLPPNRDFTVFLLQKAATPFGAAEYIGDFSTNQYGRGGNTFRLIVEEAFSSTLVQGARVRQELNRVGTWFADPADDDFCLGSGSPVTPFDGDNEAGVQAFNSANTHRLP